MPGGILLRRIPGFRMVFVVWGLIGQLCTTFIAAVVTLSKDKLRQFGGMLKGMLIITFGDIKKAKGFQKGLKCLKNCSSALLSVPKIGPKI